MLLNMSSLCVKGFLAGSVVKIQPANAGDTGSILGWEDTLEEEMATHSSILALEVPQTEQPGKLQCKITRVGHDLMTKTTTDSV